MYSMLERQCGGGGLFHLKKILQKAAQTPTKVDLFPYKQVQVREIVIMNELERPMFSYYVIYYEKFRKDLQRTRKL